jgi:hypothetical protein
MNRDTQLLAEAYQTIAEAEEKKEEPHTNGKWLLAVWNEVIRQKGHDWFNRKSFKIGPELSKAYGECFTPDHSNIVSMTTDSLVHMARIKVIEGDMITAPLKTPIGDMKEYIVDFKFRAIEGKHPTDDPGTFVDAL